MYTCIYISISICLYVYVCIYIYREREIHMYMSALPTDPQDAFYKINIAGQAASAPPEDQMTTNIQ